MIPKGQLTGRFRPSPRFRSQRLIRGDGGRHLYEFFLALLLASAVTAVSAQGQQSLTLPAIEVVGNAPVPGSEIERDKIPSNIQTVPSSGFDHTKTPSLADAMTRALPGVARGDQTGNPFQPDFDYRGFTASPVLGTPEGLAVYQNGTRINEAFGDTVNWDFIPEMAVRRMMLTPGNPVYGLNALGGALSYEMKNGFNYRGTQADVSGGSFGRIAASAQTGGQNENLSAYVTADAINDSGWRDFSSSSQLRRVYVDLGARNEFTEFHLSFTGADNKLGSVAATPVEMLNRRWSSVYTWPQTTRNQLAFLQGTASYKPVEALSLQANVYYRGFRQAHVDGNTTDAQACATPTLLCYGNDTAPLLDSAGNVVPNLFGSNLGQIDRTWTVSSSFGGSVQATNTTKVVDHGNHIVLGASSDNGVVHFSGNSELGTIGTNLFVTGTGVLIQQPTADLAPVNLRTRSGYFGVYATDTFDITPKAALTAGARLNVARIILNDQIGSALNSDNSYSRLNPVVGLTYKLLPGLTAYAGYAETNRAPTPLELGCADPARPCLIDSFLVSDPPLKQVVSHTYEAGLRGVGDQRLNWYLGFFRTLNDNDIINVPSQISGFGYFLNAAKTRRQGVETGTTYTDNRLTAYANYSFIDATFQSTLTISSPFNPSADPNGNIFATPGDRIPAVPQHRFKVGFDYAVTPPWKLGADLSAIGSQYLVGDQSNQNPQAPPYWLVNLHSSYKFDKNVEVFGLIQNLFNQRYYSAGTFFNRNGIPFIAFSDPRAFLPGMPFAAYGGIRATF